jgi:hypothetical protein
VRLDELAQDCAAAQDQVSRLSTALSGLDRRTEQTNQRLAEVTALLSRMSRQIGALTTTSGEGEGEQDGYQVNPAAPWWRPDDPSCRETADRLAAWVEDVYRPVYGYLADLLAPCWPQHPLCLASLDALHETWCLLHLQRRDPKIVLAQLDWLNRSLLQAADIMSAETKRCRDMNRHCDPRMDDSPFLGSNTRP